MSEELRKNTNVPTTQTHKDVTFPKERLNRFGERVNNKLPATDKTPDHTDAPMPRGHRFGENVKQKPSSTEAILKEQEKKLINEMSQYDNPTIDRTFKVAEHVNNKRDASPEQRNKTAKEILNKIDDKEWEKIYTENAKQVEAKHHTRESEKEKNTKKNFMINTVQKIDDYLHLAAKTTKESVKTVFNSFKDKVMHTKGQTQEKQAEKSSSRSR